MSPHPSESPPGLKVHASRAANSALTLLRTRLELASIEWAEERERLFVRLGLLFAAVLLMVFGVLGLGVLIAVYFWETQRMAAVLVPTMVCMVAGWLLFQKSKTIAQAGGLPFAATLAEFDKDRAAFTRSAPEMPNAPPSRNEDKA